MAPVKSAAFVAEEFRFREGPWDGGAIDFDEGAAMARAESGGGRGAMSSFPVPVFAEDENSESVGADGFDFF